MGKLGYVTVYKFLSEQWAIDNLVKERIKASTLSDMNDPFECLCIDFGDRDARRSWKKNLVKNYGLFGFFCMSSAWDDPVIWSHYADSHRGIALGFRVPKNAYESVDYPKK